MTDAAKSKSNFESKLDKGADRFLARAIDQVLSDGWRTPEDFLERFKPAQIMEALASAPKLRAELLVGAAGVHEKIARKKSTSSATEDLKIALEEEICNAAQILDLIPPDDRVRYLDKGALWSFATDDRFYSAVKVDTERAITRLAFLLEAALDEDVLDLKTFSDGVGFDTITESLPPSEQQRVLSHALAIGRKGDPLTEERLLEIVDLRTLVSFIPLEHIWENVIVAKIAEPAGLQEPPERAAPSKAAAKSQVAQPTAQRDKSKVAPAPKEAAKPPPKPKGAAAEQAISEGDIDVEVDELFQGASDRTPQEQEARQKVIDKLSAIDRLPPKHVSLSTAILLSIESMYAELFTLSEDDEREECIRESFPNESHLTQAMLALIELLDPSIDITDPVIRDADVESLIKVVLFEERQRSDKGRASRPSGAPPKGGRASGPPPPLPGNAKRART